MNLLRTGAAVAGSSLVLAACGGDDALSRDDYVKQANAVCRDYNQKVAGLPEPQSFEDVPAFVDKGKALAGEAVGKLDELEPPEELKADHEAFVKEGREVSATADRIAATSIGPSARIPTAPPRAAARAIDAIIAGPWSGLSSSAWHETTKPPRRAFSSARASVMPSLGGCRAARRRSRVLRPLASCGGHEASRSSRHAKRDSSLRSE